MCLSQLKLFCFNYLIKCFLGGQNFVKPPELKSKDGELKFTLNVEPKVLTFDWLSTKRRTYNGSIHGPTWRLKPGDKVTVTLVSLE